MTISMRLLTPLTKGTKGNRVPFFIIEWLIETKEKSGEL